ncbi:hypothetical protein Hdeb2414_s0124g00804291 [Helianthus debilis subsp. tardiflorus]
MTHIQNLLMWMLMIRVLRNLRHFKNLDRELQIDALYHLGAGNLIGDCIEKDIASTLLCFHRG